MNRSDPSIRGGEPLDLSAEVFGADGGPADIGRDEGRDLEVDVVDAAGRSVIGRACRLFQDDCDPSTKCVPNLLGRGTCVPAGNLGEGSRCGDEGIDDCAGDLVCLDPRPEPAGTVAICYRLCRVGGADCGEGRSCDAALGGDLVGICGD